jgi:hypothetical protein
MQADFQVLQVCSNFGLVKITGNCKDIGICLPQPVKDRFSIKIGTKVGDITGYDNMVSSSKTWNI